MSSGAGRVDNYGAKTEYTERKYVRNDEIARHNHLGHFAGFGNHVVNKHGWKSEIYGPQDSSQYISKTDKFRALAHGLNRGCPTLSVGVTGLRRRCSAQCKCNLHYLCNFDGQM